MSSGDIDTTVEIDTKGLHVLVTIEDLADIQIVLAALNNLCRREFDEGLPELEKP